MGLHSKGSHAENQPVPCAELGPMAENIAAHAADAFEDTQATLYGQADFPAHAAGQGMDERCAALHQGSRPVDLEIHQRRPVGRPAATRDVVLADPEMRKVGLRDVNAVLLPVDGHVLPEIDQLQGGADAIRLHQMLVLGPAKQVQHQPADRVG